MIPSTARIPITGAQALAPWAPPQSVVHQIVKPRFQVTYCSQCGEQFGPGNSVYSHCSDHRDQMEEGTCASCSGSGEIAEFAGIRSCDENAH